MLPLSDIAAVIEPTAMEPYSDDPHGVWIGHIRSQGGSIAVASGVALVRSGARMIQPGRIAILRGEYPIGLAVDRMLAAQAVDRDDLIPFPDAVPAIQPCPVSAAYWSEDDQLELLIDREALIAGLDSGFTGQSSYVPNRRQAHQRLLERYGDVDYRRGLEVRFDASPERWMLPMSTVRLVSDSRSPHPLPRAPQQVTGLVAWQRKPIPVIDPSFAIELQRPVPLPARFVVVGEPVGVGETSDAADAVVLVSGIVGIHNNLRIEHGYAWDVAGDAINILRIPDIFS